MAKAFNGVGQFDDGQEAAKAASEIAGQMRDKRGQAEALVTLAKAQNGRNKFKKAVATLQEATVLFRSLRDKQAEASALGSMAEIQMLMMVEEEAKWEEKTPEAMMS